MSVVAQVVCSAWITNLMIRSSGLLDGRLNCVAVAKFVPFSNQPGG